MKKVIAILTTCLSIFTVQADIVFERPLDAKTTPIGILLTWATATEDGNARFFIESSIENGEFVQVGTVDGAGFSKTSLPYNFLDANANKGNVSYRLRQVDFDGSQSFSQSIEMANKNVNNLVVKHISSASTATTLDVVIDAMKVTTLKCNVLNAKGMKVSSREVNVENGLNTIQFDLTDLPIGTYKIVMADTQEKEELTVLRVQEAAQRTPVASTERIGPKR